jgi:hypothetical protein
MKSTEFWCAKTQAILNELKPFDCLSNLGSGRRINRLEVRSEILCLAGQRAEIQEDLEWRSQVPELMELLT